MGNSTIDNGQVIGVVLLVRHGDRLEFFQNPDTYSTSDTSITPLGNAQEYQLGQLLRSIYIDPTSPSYIPGINQTVASQAQLWIRADAGGEGEGGVIYDSAVSLLQGLYPPTPDYKTQLANGTVITGPLDGYQYIPIDSVDPNDDISLEGWASCAPFSQNVEAFERSTIFRTKEAENQDFLNSLIPFIGGRSANFSDICNVFDFMNVQSIHNKTYYDNLPGEYLPRVRDLANWHEYMTFSSPELTGIGNIAGRTVLPSIFKGINDIVDPDEPTKLVYLALSYKPFLSLFNMTGMAEQNPQLAGIVDYAAAVALEVRQTGSSEPVLRFNFKNGTQDDFQRIDFPGGSGEMPISRFAQNLVPAAINTTVEWCEVCSNTQDRGCDQVAVASNIHLYQGHISPVGAGFLGAGLALAVAMIMFGVLLCTGMLAISKRKNSTVFDQGSSSELNSTGKL
ncbi:hypothetical protein AX15_000050 [Amanita polypyramis BW_CC]|nr:hypothetical protein AX15_000050 [Amanita polypyramis BW_CC]